LALATDQPERTEALDRIGKLYDVERAINGKTREQRQAVRNAQSRPLAESFKTWLEARIKGTSGKVRSHQSHPLRPLKMGRRPVRATYASCTHGPPSLLDDPAVAIDSNAAERAMRPPCLGRRNWTFAGSDRGAENAATIMTIVETAKANDLNPQAYIADLLNRLPDHKINRIEDLAPRNWKPSQ
jgi:transposase